MNKTILMGRLTKDPEVRYAASDSGMCIARYTIAVDRRRAASNDGQSADFINCVAFGKTGEFAEKYFRKGTKILITGRIQTGSYTNQEGKRIYTTEAPVQERLVHGVLVSSRFIRNKCYEIPLKKIVSMFFKLKDFDS